VHRKKEGEAAFIIVKTIPRIAVLPSRGQCLNTVTSGTRVTQRFPCKTKNLGPALAWAYECNSLSSKQNAIQHVWLSTQL
jgi:hypothetical protein